jgi:hypothetical protein
MLLLAVLLIALCAQLLAALPVVTVIDTSGSDAKYASAIQNDLKSLLTAFPDGSRVTICTVDTHARTIFSGVVDAVSRADALREASNLRYRGWSDLGAGVAEAQRLLHASGAARGVVVLLSDGDVRPEKKSKYRGRTLQQILDDPLLLASDTTLLLRLYENVPGLQVKRTNVRVFSTAPPFAQIFAPPQPAKPAPPPPAPTGTRHRISWYAALALTAVFFGGLAASGIRAVGVKRRQHREAQELRAMQDLAVHEEAPPVAPEPVARESLRYAVRWKGREAYLAGDHPQITLGDDWDATFSFGDGGTVRLLLAADGKGLRLDNVGTKPVYVGRLQVGPGRTRPLPQDRLEIGMGRECVTVVPEMFIETVAPPAAAGAQEGA